MKVRRRHNLRRFVFLRDRGRCVWCDQRVAFRGMTLDHIVPRSLGGGSSRQNLVLSCRPCNEARGNRTPWAFIVERVGLSP